MAAIPLGNKLLYRMNNNFSDLFHYNYEANNRYNVIINQSGVRNDRIYQLISHIYNIHHIWINRITGTPPDFEPWEIHTPELFQLFNNKNFSDTKQVLQQKIDFGALKNIHYNTSNASSASNNIEDILQHILQHATYHRGQLSYELKYLNINPPHENYLEFKQHLKSKH